MKYYKTFGGALSSAFAGEKDDNGNIIQATEKGMDEVEYYRYRKEEMEKKLSRFKVIE